MPERGEEAGIGMICTAAASPEKKIGAAPERFVQK
jgi:hypothetical protein